MKSIVTSRTFWLAIAQAVAGSAAALVSTDPAIRLTGWLAVGKSVVDVVLRFMTTAPVSVTGAAVKA